MEERREENLDLRQRKTRRQLTQALVELMEERPFQELSVTDICRRAMVHRTTFYAHFTDKQELLHYLLVQEAHGCIDACVPRDADSPRRFFLDAARNALDFFKSRRPLYRACIQSGADTQSGLLEDAAADELAHRLSQPPFSDLLPGTDPRITARIYVGAMLSLIRWWLVSPNPVPEQVLLDHLDRLIPQN
nr:TetR/AcrR family transcriptional regulator [uncultured Flavonifractor sp.]